MPNILPEDPSHSIAIPFETTMPSPAVTSSSSFHPVGDPLPFQWPSFLRQRIPVLLLTYHQLALVFRHDIEGDDDDVNEEENEVEEGGESEEKKPKPYGNSSDLSRRPRRHFPPLSSRLSTHATSVLLPIEQVRLCAFFDVDRAVRPFPLHDALSPLCWSSLVNTLDVACQMIFTTRGGAGGGGGGGGGGVPGEEIYEWITQTLLPNVGEKEVWGWRIQDESIFSCVQHPMEMTLVHVRRPRRSALGDDDDTRSSAIADNSTVPKGGRESAIEVESMKMASVAEVVWTYYRHRQRAASATPPEEASRSSGRTTWGQRSEADPTAAPIPSTTSTTMSEDVPNEARSSWEGASLILCCSSRREQESVCHQLPRLLQAYHQEHTTPHQTSSSSSILLKSVASPEHRGPPHQREEANSAEGNGEEEWRFLSLLRLTTSPFAFARGEAEILVVCDAQLGRLSSSSPSTTSSPFASSSPAAYTRERKKREDVEDHFFTAVSSDDRRRKPSSRFSLLAAGVPIRLLIHFSLPKGLLQRDPVEVKTFLAGRARALLGDPKSVSDYCISRWKRAMSVSGSSRESMLSSQRRGGSSPTAIGGEEHHREDEDDNVEKKEEEDEAIHSTSLLPFSFPSSQSTKVRVCVVLTDFQVRGPVGERLQEVLFHEP